MSDLILWKNQELQKIKQDMDELLASFMRDFSHPFCHDMLAKTPRMTTFETESSFIVKMDIPNLSPQSLEVILVNHDLIIQGEQDLPPSGTHGPATQKFSSRVNLSGHILQQGIRATYREGTLMITLPRKTKPERRKIQVSITS
jgi:HSP20 family molecular chaperone IbpA